MIGISLVNAPSAETPHRRWFSLRVPEKGFETTSDAELFAVPPQRPTFNGKRSV